jgi:glycosyltransferase involved in cell wall biosynthesis
MLKPNKMVNCAQMIIAINTRFLLSNYLEGYGNFIYELFTRLALQQSQHQFIFILDRPFEGDLSLPANVSTVVISPKARHPLLWHYWYNVKVSTLLKKVKADVFISPDGFCSLTTKIPQITVIHDLAFLQYPKAIKKSHLWYYKRYTPKFIAKSKAIVAVSNYTKQDIVGTYKISNEKITVIYNAANALFKPLDWKLQEVVKEQYTNGKEYFVCVTSIHPRKNVMNLLKAFSIFKKWQKCNMKLVLVGRLAWKNNAFEKLLATYKYKEDVVLLGHQPNYKVAPIIGAAYCAVYPSLFEGFGVPIIEAMQCHIPVITSNNSGMLEAGGDAALYANPQDIEDIAGQMQKIYKDETLRSQLIEKGKQHVQSFNWEQSAREMWHIVEKIQLGIDF